MDSIKTGLLAGISMAVVLAILSIQGQYGTSPLKYLKYLVLIAFLIGYFSKLVDNKEVKSFFISYLQGGAIVSATAAIVVAAVNVALFMINPDFAIQKINLTATSYPELLMVSIVLVVEVFVLGMLCSFVIFPYFKNKMKIRESTL